MTLAQPGPDPLQTQKESAQAQLQRAVGEGRLTLDEFTDRVGRVWATEDAAVVATATADLPVQVVGTRSTARATLVGLIGDVRRSGRWSLRRRTTAYMVIGDVELDLRGALVIDSGEDPEPDEITITVISLIGDAEVVVPEGVDAELSGVSVLGDHRVELAPVA